MLRVGGGEIFEIVTADDTTPLVRVARRAENGRRTTDGENCEKLDSCGRSNREELDERARNEIFVGLLGTIAGPGHRDICRRASWERADDGGEATRSVFNGASDATAETT